MKARLEEGGGGGGRRRRLGKMAARGSGNELHSCRLLCTQSSRRPSANIEIRRGIDQINFMQDALGDAKRLWGDRFLTPKINVRARRVLNTPDSLARHKIAALPPVCLTHSLSRGE